MRGNELRQVTTVPLRKTFPIPMRGNEDRALQSADPVAVLFPIPMRGNEDGPGALAHDGPDGFPIPMRGNEDDEDWRLRLPPSRFRSP